MGIRALLVTGTAALAALTLTLTMAPLASAQPAERQVGIMSGSGGSRSGDFTGDGVGDILARDARNGQLKVYPHSGTFNGVQTFPSVVTINHGWGTMRWIGQGDINGDKLADVVYVDSAHVMHVAPHSGTFNGLSTLTAGQVISTGWHVNDLIFTFDYNADGFDDVLARRAGTGDTYIYFNNGGLDGTNTLQAPQLVSSGPPGADVDQTMGDFTGDNKPDLLFVQTDGVLGLVDFQAGVTYSLGYGWNTINAITVTDVNRDGKPDVLGRRASDSALLAYTHSGTWAPAPDRTAYNTLRAPVFLGSGWNINNVIT